MSSQSVVLHIQIIDHLDHDSTLSYERKALYQHHPFSLSYTEQDDSTQVGFTILPTSLTLKRVGAWQTQIHFNPFGLGTFSVLSELGEMKGEVKILNSLIKNELIQITYQLIMEHTVITHQTLTYTIRGAQA
jgi:hypothetical protein